MPRLLRLSFLLAACGSSPGLTLPDAPAPDASPAALPSVESFTASPDVVFVGEHAQLTAVFVGDEARIDGLGPIASGMALATPPLAGPTTFTLVVRRGDAVVEVALEVQPRYHDRFRALAAASVARTQHLAAALADGGAIAMGGHSSEFPNVPDSETSQRFDPVTERMVPGPALVFTALEGENTVLVPLGDGFLLAGGGINSFHVGAEGRIATQRFEAAGPSFARAADLSVPLATRATAAALADGGALITGGFGAADAQRYHPDRGKWAAATSLPAPRRGHSATLLHDGRVLLAGGFLCCVPIEGGAREFAATSALIYDPGADTFTPTGDLAKGRAFHEATLLPDGRVLVTGGLGDDATPAPTAAEIYDPAAGTFGPAGELSVGRALHGAVALTDGRVLVVGGADTVTLQTGIEATEIYDPATNRWSAGPALRPAWARATVTPLASGKVLVFGGEDAGGFPRPDVLLFE